MTNIRGLGKQDGNWKNSSFVSREFETLTIFPQEVVSIVDVTSDYNKTIVFLSEKGKLYQANPGRFQEKLKAFENLPPMKSVCAGYYHFLAMTDEEHPKVYSWGQNDYLQLGMTGNISHTKPTLVEAVNKFNVDEAHCSGYASFFYNKEKKVLYGCGKNTNSELGTNDNVSPTKIQKLHENVTKVFSGQADHTFIVKTNGKLYGLGYNLNGQFGIGTRQNNKTPTEITLDFPIENISKLELSFQHSVILTNDGKVYVTGNKSHTGFGSDLQKFQQYPQFKNEKIFIKDMSSGYLFITFLTEDNEIWIGGTFNGEKPLSRYKKLEDLSFNMIKSVSHNAFFMLKTGGNYLSQDFKKLLENGYFSDCKIQDIPVHKLLIEIRLGKDFDEIKKYLEENCTKKEIQDLLKWIYCDQTNSLSKTNEILSHFGIQETQKKTKLLQNDLKKLLFDEETSDFTLVVQNDENEDEDDDEIEEEELPVHKFILAARSGLFLDLFQNLDKNLQKVTDYSKKSLESIELLIAFLYTDEIPITADTDQELTKEEFEDIVEYYQLNPKIPILDIFEKCSKK
ncbi:btk-binding protein-related [Anaeramoeba flamelloides]|uniref:Btk-binding protein-related n=1 Tax=Anaeramoeba flamelloides TaxID=1746091 RepID=A0ABQ8X2Y5_9EUKA|nr:btk-binding protein-related [Anaeramoeba flamelloides]